MGFVVVIMLLVFGLPAAGVSLIAWLIYRYKTERDRRDYAVRLAMAQSGVDPVTTDQPPQVTKRKSANSLLVWGVVLALAGLGLTIGEIANAGLGNAGMEMAIMFAGIGLLAIYKHRGSDESDDADRNSDQHNGDL